MKAKAKETKQLADQIVKEREIREQAESDLQDAQTTKQQLQNDVSTDFAKTTEDIATLDHVIGNNQSTIDAIVVSRIIPAGFSQIKAHC